MKKIYYRKETIKVRKFWEFLSKCDKLLQEICSEGKWKIWCVEINNVNTNSFSDGAEDDVLGLNAMEKFSKVIINLKDMYMEAIPFTEKQ